MNTDEPVKKSSFVTVIAWILIIITGFSTFIAALQNIMIQVLFDDAMKEEMMKGDPESFDQMPDFFTFMFENFDLIVLGFFIINLVAFIASIGLLKRKNWGRYIIIGLMALGIAWNFGGLYMQQSVVSDMEQFQAGILEEQQEKAKESRQSSAVQTDDEECCESDPCCDQNQDHQNDVEERKQEFEEFQKHMDMMQSVMFWIGLLMAIAFTLIEGFIIWKLCTPKIVAEFKS